MYDLTTTLSKFRFNSGSDCGALDARCLSLTSALSDRAARDRLAAKCFSHKVGACSAIGHCLVQHDAYQYHSGLVGAAQF